jgi:lipoyl(octanoyl) transferase
MVANETDGLSALLHSTLQMTRPDAAFEVEWLRSVSPVPYPEAVAAMESRVSAILAKEAPEAVWLLEHPPLYTAGISASPEELLEPERLPVFVSGRGGRFTYHGPGQRIAYVMLDLGRRDRRDVRTFVHDLESWLIVALANLGVEAGRREGEIGVFAGEAKIASIGIRLRRWVSFHGVSLNVDPDLSHFAGIIPCGHAETPTTSLAALGAETDIASVDAALRDAFEALFGSDVA